MFECDKTFSVLVLSPHTHAGCRTTWGTWTPPQRSAAQRPRDPGRAADTRVSRVMMFSFFFRSDKMAVICEVSFRTAALELHTWPRFRLRQLQPEGFERHRVAGWPSCGLHRDSCFHGFLLLQPSHCGCDHVNRTCLHDRRRFPSPYRLHLDLFYTIIYFPYNWVLSSEVSVYPVNVLLLSFWNCLWCILSPHTKYLISDNLRFWSYWKKDPRRWRRCPSSSRIFFLEFLRRLIWYSCLTGVDSYF